MRSATRSSSRSTSTRSSRSSGSACTARTRPRPQRPLDLPDDAEDDGRRARIERCAGYERAQIVVDAVGVVLVEEADLAEQLPRALVNTLDGGGVGELARLRRRCDLRQLVGE